MPLIARQIISELTSDEIKIGSESVGQVKKVKTISKLDAVEKLMRHLGAYEKDNKQRKISVDLSNLTTEELVARAKAIKQVDEQTRV